MSESIGSTPPALRRLLDRLQAFVVNWNPTSDEYVLGRDRKAENIETADVASSLLKNQWGATDRHIIALDIDYPVHVVESSTAGHWHLYIDVPGGIEHQGYMALVSLLGHLKVIEAGYANVSDPARAHRPEVPPYSNFMPWAERFTKHDRMVLMGICLPEVRWFPIAFSAADAVAFISCDFVRPNGSKVRLRQQVFVAFRGVGLVPAERLAAADPYGAFLRGRAA